MKTFSDINFTTVSEEFDLIKLTEAQLRGSVFTILDLQLYSTDSQEPNQVQVSATSTQLCGYVEYVTDTSPALSISWDWSIQHGSIQYVDDPFTNFEVYETDYKLPDLLRTLLQPQTSGILLKLSDYYR